MTGDSSSAKKFRRLTWLAVAVGVLLSYQNCSDVSFTPAPGNENVKLGNPDHFYSDLAIGRAEMPDLKMVFVVDNSYTMTANQVNLSQSVANMLSPQNSSNLTPFNTTAYLFNTAQLSLGATSSKLPTLANLQIPFTQLQNMVAQPGFSKSAFLSANRPAAPAELSGAIPGDTIGYNVVHLASTGNNTYDYKFKPMPVLSFDGSGNSAGSAWSVARGIYKPVNVTADAMVADFQERLALLNNLRSANDYPEISDSESGMCALARILNNHTDYFNAGDVPAFVLITDENEANVAGDKCLDSYQTLTGSENLVKGYCEERKTTIVGDYPVVTPAACTLNYKNAYDVKYTYTVPATKVNYFVRTTESPRTKINYFKSTGYKAYKSKITYEEISSVKYKRTSVKFYLTECEVRDGVIVDGSCRPVLQPIAYVDGDATGDCVAAAKGINDKVLWGTTVTTAQQPVCAIAEPRALAATEICEVTNDNCIYTYKLSYATVYGQYATAEECANRADAITNALVSASHIPVCEVVETLNPTTGVCPAEVTGCEQNVATAVTTVDGNFTTSFEVCQTQAKTLGSAYVTNDYPAICAFDTNKITYCDALEPSKTVCPRTANIEGVYGVCLDFAKNKKSSMPGIILDDTNYMPVCATGTPIDKAPVTKIDFTSAILSVGLQMANAICPQVVLDAFFVANPSLPRSGGVCKINAIKSATSKIIKGALTCDQVRTNFEATNVVLMTGLVENPSITTMTKYSKSVDQDVLCSTPCANTNFCTTAAGGANVNGSIADYLKSIYGSALACSVGGVVKTKIANLSFADLVNTRIDTACPQSSTGVVRYAVQEGAIYHSIGSKGAFVAGTGVSGVSNIPAMALPQFIREKSNEVFGTGKAILTTFVRQSQDGTGKGGSVGTAYEALADSMNGQKYSVMLNDYSPALVQLSQVLKSRLVRSMVVPELVARQKIYNVWVRRGGAPWLQIDKQMWSQSGSTLTLDASVDIELGDKVKVEFY